MIQGRAESVQGSNLATNMRRFGPPHLPKTPTSATQKAGEGTRLAPSQPRHLDGSLPDRRPSTSSSTPTSKCRSHAAKSTPELWQRRSIPWHSGCHRRADPQVARHGFLGANVESKWNEACVLRLKPSSGERCIGCKGTNAGGNRGITSQPIAVTTKLKLVH
jgi:hypothetical protein